MSKISQKLGVKGLIHCRFATGS